jgi:hypothetical protein
MKEVNTQKSSQKGVKMFRLKPTAKEIRALQTSLKQVNKLANRLGLFDPIDLESPMIYFAEEGKR